MKKFYFAGSIRGGREDKELYLEIINLLKIYGTVLTEHIGDQSLTDFGQDQMSDYQIYKKDTNWILEANVIIAEVTTPSLGVGYELGFAESLNKKIILLYRPQENKRLSAMLAGNKYFEILNYQNIEDLKLFFESKFI